MYIENKEEVKIMKIVNEPRYQDFNGKVHKTELECIRAEDAFTDKVFSIFDELAKGCNDSSCKQCPFYDNGDEICYFERKIGSIPESWIP